MNWIQLLSVPLAVVIGFILGFGIKTTIQLGKAEANELLFTTPNDGLHWYHDGKHLGCSPLTDCLQDAFTDVSDGRVPGHRCFDWPMVCTREPNHDGPCNGFASHTCSEASRRGCYGP